MVESSTAK
jgi:hypothetical protein